MKVRSIDHVALTVADVPRTCRFYERVLGMKAREERPGKWCLDFGSNKISLHDPDHVPEDAKNAVPGSGNFCMLTDAPSAVDPRQLRELGIRASGAET